MTSTPRAMRTDTVYDLAVIGAGPAGLTAAHFALVRGLRVAIIEKNGVYGKKLRITGKGRCNLVNDCDEDEFLSQLERGGRFLNSAVRGFSPREIMEFFESLGVPLKTERGRRVFPVSDSADDIANALETASKGAARITGEAKRIITDENAVTGVELKDGRTVRCHTALISTGGLSYPGTGSTGDGYTLARSLGHTVNEPRASLVPMCCAEADCAAMQGLSLKNVRLVCKIGKKTLFDEQGELLFTHFGVSGPLILSLSARLADTDLADTETLIDLKPALDEAALDRRILRDFSENLNREYRNSLSALLPNLLIAPVVARSGIDPAKRVNSVTACERRALLETLKRFRITLTKRRPVAEAVITAGGVELKEIDSRTMGSKLVKGLYFAGEVIDADGPTGGYNLGIAFATGALAGKSVTRIQDTD